MLSSRNVGASPPAGDLYLNEPWVSIRWDDVHHCVHTEWKAFANSAEFRAALMRALDAIRDKGSIRYLSDTRKVKVVVHAGLDPTPGRRGCKALCAGNSGGRAR